MSQGNERSLLQAVLITTPGLNIGALQTTRPGAQYLIHFRQPLPTSIQTAGEVSGRTANWIKPQTHFVEMCDMAVSAGFVRHGSAVFQMPPKG